MGTKKAHQKTSSGKKKSSASPPKVISKKAHQNAAKASAKKPAQKTAGNVGKGKVICGGSVDSDEDSLGFDDEGMMKLMAETQKKNERKKTTDHNSLTWVYQCPNRRKGLCDCISQAKQDLLLEA